MNTFNWSRCRAIDDPVYRKAREALIPMAAKIADLTASYDPYPEVSILSDQDPGTTRWNLCFLREMDRLVREHGLLQK